MSLKLLSAKPRSIIRLGEHSNALVLSAKWCKKHGIEKGDLLLQSEDRQGRLVIERCPLLKRLDGE